MGIEQRLVQTEVSISNPQLAELQREAIEMARFYYKGFGAVMSGILGNGEFFLEEEERRDLIEKSYDWFGRIENFYSKIPFDMLQRREEFYPLFVVRDLLPQFRNVMDNVFKNRKRDALKQLERKAQTIINVGGLYRENLESLLDNIRLFPEAKDFRVAIPDQNKNYTWYF